MRRVRACHHPVPVLTVDADPDSPSSAPRLRKIIFTLIAYQLCVLAIRLLLATRFALIAAAFRSALKCNSERVVQTSACVSARFHPHANLDSLLIHIAVELLRFLAVLQSPLLQFPSLESTNALLEARVIITTYNHRVRLLSPERSLVGFVATKVYSATGANIVMGIVSLTTGR